MENELCHGAIHQPVTAWLKNFLHLKHHQIAGTEPFDWSHGIPEPSISIFNQGQSDGCGAYATGYGYQRMNPGLLVSRKDCYSQVFAPGGGTTDDALDSLTALTGVCKESLISSYNNGFPPDEGFLTQRLQTPATRQDALLQKLPWGVPVSLDIDSIAQAIRDNGWVRITIRGQNNGTWLSAFPQPTGSNSNDYWYHFMCVLVPVLDPVRGKTLSCPQSWGLSVGNQGWQVLTQAHFDRGDILAAQTFPKIDLSNFTHTFASYLWFGMSGPEVLALQMALAKDGEFTVQPTGFFGSTTFYDVMAFQKKYGILQTGFVGPSTLAQLNKLFSGK